MIDHTYRSFRDNLQDFFLLRQADSLLFKQLRRIEKSKSYQTQKLRQRSLLQENEAINNELLYTEKSLSQQNQISPSDIPSKNVKTDSWM